MAAVLTLEGAARRLKTLVCTFKIEVQDREPEHQTHPTGCLFVLLTNLSIDGFTVAFDDSEKHVADGGHIRFGLDTIKMSPSAAVSSVSDVPKMAHSRTP